MSDSETQKPSCDDWCRWSQVVVARLTTIIQTYNKPSPDQDISNNERQLKVSPILEILRRLNYSSDEIAEARRNLSSESDPRTERAVADLRGIFSDILHRLPVLSSDMQRLLKSEWRDSCNGTLATVLFRGPDGKPEEGIGSGKPEDGRLPKVLADMLARESNGDSRKPPTEPADSGENGEGEPQRHQIRQNRASLSSAGRVE